MTDNEFNGYSLINKYFLIRSLYFESLVWLCEIFEFVLETSLVACQTSDLSPAHGHSPNSLVR